MNESLPDFAARLAIALEMNGYTNATFAAALGEYGQQNVNAFKKRGQIGGPSVRRVIELLPKTNFLWLQYGIGERFSGPHEFSTTDPNDDFRQSRFLSLDPATIRNVLTGLTWRFKTEGQEFDLERDADLFALSCVFAMTGDAKDRSALQAATDARIAQLTGESHGQPVKESSRSSGSGPN